MRCVEARVAGRIWLRSDIADVLTALAPAELGTESEWQQGYETALLRVATALGLKWVDVPERSNCKIVAR